MCGIRKQLETDYQTGCKNRRYFDRLKIKECWVAVVDVDELKQINDTMGHHAGDAAIQQVANFLKNIGTTIRYSGDEFVCIMNKKNAQILDSGKFIGFSKGIIHKTAAMSLKEAVKEADKLMYKEKKKYQSRINIKKLLKLMDRDWETR